MLFNIVIPVVFISLFICNVAVQPGGGVRRVLGVNWKRGKRVRGQKETGGS